MSHIFISYSRKDKGCVYPIYEEMKKQDFSVWLDLEAIPITTEWLEEIEKAIHEAKVFMLFWSKNAQQSDYVQHELKIAKQLSITGKIKVLVVMMDDTPIPLKHLQGYDMKSGCSKAAIQTLIQELSPEWKTFSYSKTLAEQSNKLVAGDYVSVLYDAGKECKAYIVGKKDRQLAAKPADLVVVLQFFRSTEDDIFESVLNSLPTSDAWILHITGPVAGDNYSLNNNKPAQWETSRQFVVDTIQKVGNKDVTTIHFFTLTPNALLGGVTMPLYRFWRVKLYNYVSARYLPVVEIDRS